MPKFLDVIKQGISEASSQIKEKGLGGWVGERSAETGKMFGDAALELAAKELDLNSEEIEQLKNLRDNAEALKQLKEQLGDVDLKDVDPEVVKRNLEYLSKTDLSKTGLGSETAKEIVQEEAPKVVVEQTTTTTVPKVEQIASSVTPEVVKKFNILDLNKNGKISDDLLKIGLGVGAAAALGYGAHKLYKHLKNKRKDMSEQSKKKMSLGKKVALGILGAGALGAGAYGMYKLGMNKGLNEGIGKGFGQGIHELRSVLHDKISNLPGGNQILYSHLSPDEVHAEYLLNGEEAAKMLEGLH